MTIANWISLIGMAIEALGIILTGRGFWQTWHEFRPDESLIGDAARILAARARIGRAVGRAGNFLRRLPGYPLDVLSPKAP